jgi:hypothetical protein
VRRDSQSTRVKRFLATTYGILVPFQHVDESLDAAADHASHPTCFCHQNILWYELFLPQEDLMHA